MANEEIKYFNVKNTSVRLVHVGGVMIPPDHIKPLIDDDLGINRATVEGEQWLEITDEEPTDTIVEEVKPVAKKGNAKTTTAKTPTGAGWSAGKN